VGSEDVLSLKLNEILLLPLMPFAPFFLLIGVMALASGLTTECALPGADVEATGLALAVKLRSRRKKAFRLTDLTVGLFRCDRE